MVGLRVVAALPCLTMASIPRQGIFHDNLRTGVAYSTWTEDVSELTAVGSTFSIAASNYDSPDVVGKWSMAELCERFFHCIDSVADGLSLFGELVDVVPPAGALDGTSHTVLISEIGANGDVQCHFVQGKYACHTVDVQLYNIVSEAQDGSQHTLRVACHSQSSLARMNGCHVTLPGDLIFNGHMLTAQHTGITLQDVQSSAQESALEETGAADVKYTCESLCEFTVGTMKQLINAEGCTAAAVEGAAACEAAGGGPEDPLADICAVIAAQACSLIAGHMEESNAQICGRISPCGGSSVVV